MRALFIVKSLLINNKITLRRRGFPLHYFRIPAYLVSKELKTGYDVISEIAQ
jgi:predicted deacetylase